jgi:integrase
MRPAAASTPRPRLQPIPAARHTRDAECPDAGWKRLTNTQKGRLAMLAAKAYRVQKVQGMELDEWRHEVAIRACGCRISEAVQRQWADLKTAFQDLAGDPVGAMRTQIREGDNKRRIALHKLTTACAERGLDMSYAESICRSQFKVPVSQASAKQIWCLFYTVRNRRKSQSTKSTKSESP